MFRSRVFSYGIALLLGLASSSFAQRTTGSIVGQIVDDTGGVLPGVSVTLEGTAVAGRLTTTTGEGGRYQFPSLPPGRYELRFELAGFAALTRERVWVNVGTPVEINETLRIAALAEDVTVTAGSPVINTTSAEVTSVLNEDWLRAAPIERNYFELLKEGPGVNTASSTAVVALTVFGSGVSDNLFQVDGADQRSPHSANTSPTVYPNPDVLGEVEFLGLGAPAEYGDYMGGVFNVVTRQGGDELHGDVNYFFQSDALTARNTTDAEDLGRPYHRDSFHDVTAQLGGPLQKERLWFFGSYQYQEDLFSGPGADPAFPSGTEISRYFFKLSYQASPNHRLVGSLNPNQRSSVTAGSQFIEPTSIVQSPQWGFTPSVVWNATISTTTALEVRGSFHRSDFVAEPPEGQPGRKTRFIALDTGRTSGGVQLVGESIYKKLALSAKLARYADRFLGGSHEVKLGVQYHRGSADNSFFYNDVVYTLGGVPQNGYAQTQSVYGAEPDGMGLFVDDTFRPSDRVSLTLGLRYDHSHIGAPAYPELDLLGNPTGTTFPAIDELVTWNTLAPRLGLNVKLDSEGRTVLKAHYGRYFQSLSVAAAFYRVLPSSPARFSFSGRYDEAGGHLGLVPLAVSSNRAMDGEVGAPRTDQYVVGLEHEIRQDLGVGVHFVHKRGSHYMAWDDIGASYLPVDYLDTQGQDATGGPIPVFQLTSPPSDRFFLLTDPEEVYSRYRGITFNLNKRFDERWQLASSLTWGKSEGRLISSTALPGRPQNTAPIFNSFGQNPNDYVNTDGLLLNDRPILFKVQAVAALPGETSLSASYQYLSGAAWGRTLRISDLGLPTTIRAEPLDGGRRLEALNLLDLRVEKSFSLARSFRISILGDILNLLNAGAAESVVSTLGTSNAFGTPASFQYPLRLMVGTRLRF
jgi:hypothetical protein